MNFVTIDFETANQARTSPCELGLTFVNNGQVGETKSWLIRPRPNDFDYFNVLRHGIRAEMVADQPEFDVIWKEVQPMLEGAFVIAHNASFDMSVLRRTLEQFQLGLPNLDYGCSYIFSKHVWKDLPSYGLDQVCAVQGIQFKHHRAGPDCRATAELALRIFEEAGITAKEEIPDKLKTRLGCIKPDGYAPCKKISPRVNKWRYDLSKIVGDPAKHNPESIFYGSTVVFTGVLSSMTRTEAQQAIADIGGIIGSSVTKATEYLVVGQQDFRLVGDDGMSNKQEKAIRMKAAGADIEIISEADFLKNL